MSLSRHLAGGLACLALLASAAAARADAPPDPLRLVPNQASLLLEIKQPRQLAESVTRLDLFKQLQTVPTFREFFDSTAYRRFYQLIAYYEKQLGAQWPELLDKLAGGGAVVAVKTGEPDPAPAWLVLQGRDEALARKFAELGLQVLEQELARQESKDKVEKGEYRKLPTVRAGKEFHAAVIGSAIIIANNEAGLHAALDCHLDGGKKSLAKVASIANARKLLPAGPLATAWLDLETARKNEQVKQAFEKGRDPNLTVLFGGWLDAARRSPYLAAGLYRDQDDFVLRLRMPAGRDGMGPEVALHAAPPGQPGCRPLLEPKGVLYSQSFYLDVARFWNDRKDLFTEAQVKQIEQADKNAGAAIAGLKLSKVLGQAGSYHRVVVVNQPQVGYAKARPKQPIPAFAFVTEPREPEAFANSMEGALRGIALLAGGQFRLRLAEEKHANSQIVGWRFPENGKVPNDVNDVRFNFSPCFARVGSQFVISSTIELCRELIDLLGKEAREGTSAKGGGAAFLARGYSAGAADFLATIQDQLVVQTILDESLAPEKAKEQVRALIDLVRHAGQAQIETRYGAKEFGADIRVKLGK